MRSDHGCDCKGSRDDIQTGGGEGWGHITDATTKRAGMTYTLEVERERDGVRSWMRLQKDRRHTAWRWSAMGSYHGCGCKGSRDDVPTGGEEETGWDHIMDATVKGAYQLEAEKGHDGVRSWMRLRKEQGRRTTWW
jgi:hypothetical protein